jgi:hypothetical protein
MSDYVSKVYGDGMDEVTYDTTSDNISVNEPHISTTGNIYTQQQLTFPTTHHQYAPSTIAPIQPTCGQPYYGTPDPWVQMPPIEGADELCEMLGVPELPHMSTGSEGPTLRGVSGKCYALVDVMRAQMEFMTRLNILLVHRNLVPELE